MWTTDTQSWFLEQVEREHIRLRAYIRSMGVRAEEVDDLAQEVFLLSWEKIEEISREGHFGGWVRQVARRLIANERRKDSRRSRLLSDHITDLLLDHDDGGPSEAPGSDSDPNHEIELDALRDCLSRMPQEHRELLRKRYFEDLSPGTIGGVLGKSSNQVRQSLLRLRRSLLLCIKSRLPARAI